MRRLGILGGSFDPIHIAHLLVAETVREALNLDLVLFLPVGRQPLKPGKPQASVEHRVAMVARAIEGNPHFALSRLDADRPGPSYTVDTLRQIREEQEEPVDMWFIVGADSLLTFPRWRDPAGILGLARLAVVRRPGYVPDISPFLLQLPKLGTSTDWVDAPLMEISATDIRRRVSEGRSIRYRVKEGVREYILTNHLYLGESD